MGLRAMTVAPVSYEVVLLRDPGLRARGHYWMFFGFSYNVESYGSSSQALAPP